MSDTGNIEITYHFQFPDGAARYDLALDSKSVTLCDRDQSTIPPWTALDFHQCPHCPLSKEENPQCPLAVALSDVLIRCNSLLSYEKIFVQVTTPERTISKETSAQQGLRSLMGLIMPTSGCPHTAFLKPMARFHLPFASAEETIYRATSMYLLAQYFRWKQGEECDFQLSSLKSLYENLRRLNRTFADRIRAATTQDSSVNAVVLLDLFAMTLSDAIDESLEEIKYLFVPLLGYPTNLAAT